MPTTITSTIGPGKDYSSRAAWEAAKQGDLVAADQVQQGEIYNFNDTTDLVIDGSTVDSTHYMRLYVAGGEGHAGVWSASKARLTGGAFGGNLANIIDQYFRWEGDQISHTGGGSDSASVRVSEANVLLQKLVVKGTAADTYGIVVQVASAAAIIENCVAFDAGINIQCRDANTSGTIRNCTSIDGLTYGFLSNSGGNHMTLVECLSSGSVTLDFVALDGGTVLNPTYCASEDATADDWGGAGNRINQTFTFTNTAGDDFTLSSNDLGAKDFGDTTGSPSDDVVGTSRPQGANRDIGFFEVKLSVAAAVHPPVSVRIRPRLFSPGIAR